MGVPMKKGAGKIQFHQLRVGKIRILGTKKPWFKV
jgi:hypothetical protein